MPTNQTPWMLFDCHPIGRGEMEIGQQRMGETIRLIQSLEHLKLPKLEAAAVAVIDDDFLLLIMILIMIMMMMTMMIINLT
jgi:hypothetical protein